MCFFLFIIVHIRVNLTPLAHGESHDGGRKESVERIFDEAFLRLEGLHWVEIVWLSDSIC